MLVEHIRVEGAAEKTRCFRGVYADDAHIGKRILDDATSVFEVA
jgi:hypothetical protein